MKKPIYLLLFLLLLALFFSQAEASTINKVAATVNGQPITMFDLQKNAIPELVRARLNPNDPSKAKAVRAVYEKVLDGMILDILLLQEAKRLKATVSRSEIDEEISLMMKTRKLNKDQFEAQLKQQNMTVAELRKTVEKNLIRQKIMAMEVGRRVVVTPDEIRKYYEEHKDAMVDRRGLHMGLLVYHPNAPAREIAARIKAGKMSFAEAAAKYSIAPNKERGGDTGPIEWGKLNPEWEGRLNRMKPGDVTPIFDLPDMSGKQKFKAQVHLFRPGGGSEKMLSFEDAKPMIDNLLRQPKAQARFEEYTRQLREKAIISIKL